MAALKRKKKAKAKARRERKVSPEVQSKARQIMAILQALEGLTELRTEVSTMREMIGVLIRAGANADNRVTTLEGMTKSTVNVQTLGLLVTRLEALEKVAQSGNDSPLAVQAELSACEAENARLKADLRNECAKTTRLECELLANTGYKSKIEKARQILEAATTLHAAQQALEVLK